MADVNGALSKLQQMLSTDEGKKQLEDMLGAFRGSAPDNSQGQNQQTTAQNPLNSLGNFDTNSLLKVKNVMDELQNNNDPRANLLNALKPYLSTSRYSHIDETIRLLSLTKIPNIIKTMRK